MNKNDIKWIKLLREYEEDPYISVTNFCKKHSVTKSLFYYYRRKFSANTHSSNNIADVTSLVKNSFADTSTDSTLVINGVTVSVDDDISVKLLTKLVEVCNNV